MSITSTCTINGDNINGCSVFIDAKLSITKGNEDGTPVAIVTVTRSLASLGNVSVTLNLSNGTPTAGSDYTNNSPITVSFAEGETSKTISVPIIEDNLVEGNETRLSSIIGTLIVFLVSPSAKETVIGELLV